LWVPMRILRIERKQRKLYSLLWKKLKR